MVTAFLEITSSRRSGTKASVTSETYAEHGVTLIYDDAMDELQIHSAVGPLHRHADPVNRYLYRLVDSDTDIPFGFMLESFLTHTVHELPRLNAIAQYLQLGERPYQDPNMYRQDTPPRTSVPDYAFSDAAHDAVQNIVEITGGIQES